jgi:hypothetical protein
MINRRKETMNLLRNLRNLIKDTLLEIDPTTDRSTVETIGSVITSYGVGILASVGMPLDELLTRVTLGYNAATTEADGDCERHDH